MHGMEYTAEVEEELRQKKREDQHRRQMDMYGEVPADPSEVDGEIVLSEEIKEVQDAFEAYDQLRTAIRNSNKQKARQKPLTKEQLMIKRAKERKAKRKRGGPR